MTLSLYRSGQLLTHAPWNADIRDMSIHTVLLTRFNMALPEAHRAGHRIVDTAMQQWLDNRTAIFEHVCFPSVIAQTRLPDVWMIGFDTLRRETVAKVLDMIRPYPWIMPVWQEFDGTEHINPRHSFRLAIGNTFPEREGRLLTTRLDSDDALSLSYCEAVRDHAANAIGSAADDFWISFPFGLHVSNGVCRSMKQENNAFLTRCSTFKTDPLELRIALGGNHTNALQQGNVVLSQISQPMWLQYVHGTNLLNPERKDLRRVRNIRAELARFGLSKDLLNFQPPCIDRASLFESGAAPKAVNAVPVIRKTARKVKALLKKTFGPRA